MRILANYLQTRIDAHAKKSINQNKYNAALTTISCNCNTYGFFLNSVSIIKKRSLRKKPI